jgi:alpha-L-fucosidase
VKKNCLLLISFLLLGPLAAQHETEEKYVPEKDPAAAAKIKQWQNLKFGLLMHWGTYSPGGIVEFWAICPGGDGWGRGGLGLNPGN